MSQQSLTDFEKRLPAFDNREAAMQWMYAKVDDDYVDNERFAFNDDREAILKYNQAQNEGCCGFFDREVLVGGRLATVGCNYGH